MSIKVKDVTYTYMKKTPYEKTALKNVSLEIKEGSFVAIAGHTGSGKSTLMQHLNGILQPTQGSVFVDDINVNGNKKEKAMLRGRVGMVFQYPEHQLFEETVYKDIAFGPKNFGFSEEQIKERVQMAMDFVGLDYERYKDASPFSLSGGQMRRVAIAGTIALKPHYVIFDEPTAGLDPRSKRELLINIKRLHDKGDCTVVMVSHNMDDILQLSQRVIVLSEGKIIADGKPSQVFLQQETLSRAGLDMPHLLSFMNRARELKVVSQIECSTVKEASLAIYEAWKRGGKNAQ